MKRLGLFAIALSLSVFLFGFEAAAHSCNKGIKRAHCYCKYNLNVNGVELARVVNHGQCYNQQSNLGLGSSCANYCRGQDSTLQNQMRAALIAKSLCGKRTATRKYSAGTNPYLPYGTVSLTGC